MKSYLKNSGFSLIECIFCILLLSSGIIGIFVPLTIIRNNYNQRYYESVLGINYYSIFCIFTSDPQNAEEYFITYFNGVKKEDGSIDIEVKLKQPYKNFEKIVFNVALSDTENRYIMEVKVKEVHEYYETINNSSLSKREIPK